MCNPWRNTAVAAFTLSMAASRSLRSTGTKDAIFMPAPRMGMRKSSFFTSTEQRPGIVGSRTGGSRLEVWFDMKM